jgi:hypothetical protein
MKIDDSMMNLSLKRKLLPANKSYSYGLVHHFVNVDVVTTELNF